MCVWVSPPFTAACVLFSERPGKVSAVKLSLLNTEEPHVTLETNGECDFSKGFTLFSQGTCEWTYSNCHDALNELT